MREVVSANWTYEGESKRTGESGQVQREYEKGDVWGRHWGLVCRGVCFAVGNVLSIF